tara:strand:- start:123 stop:392 length:270 start_codon:yes stop_codon:yes gene_type:complete
MKSLSIKSLINSNKGKMLLSIILGFGIATLFRKACKDRNCLVFHAPSINKIKGKTFSYNNKCYEYIENNTKCDKNKNILNINSEKIENA